MPLDEMSKNIHSNKIITICSGKGGTGKSIISANLAYLLSRDFRTNVLLIDLDFHVRGLTYLLFQDVEDTFLSDDKFSKKRINLFSLLTSNKDSTYLQKKTIIPFFKANIKTVLELKNTKIDLLSCFFEKGELVDWKQLGQLETIIVWKNLKSLLSSVKKENKYGAIFLDTRAGPDTLSLAACLASDIALIVTEQDTISKRSSFNFLVQLKSTLNELRRESKLFKSKVNEYFILNKCTLPKSIQKESFFETNVLPIIRFNKRIYDEYGNNQFVIKQIKRTSFESYLNNIINELKKELDIIDVKRISESSFHKRLLLLYSDIFIETKKILFKKVIIIPLIIITIMGLILQSNPVRDFFSRLFSKQQDTALYSKDFTVTPSKFYVKKEYSILITSQKSKIGQDVEGREKMLKLVLGSYRSIKEINIDILDVSIVDAKNIVLKVVFPYSDTGIYSIKLRLGSVSLYGGTIQIDE